MDYLKIYNNLIERGKKRVLTGYTETHHIIPKCVGGTNNIWNLVKLTAKEHFICHLLLCKIYPGNKKLIFALWNMCNVKRDYQKRYQVNSSLYNLIREEYSNYISGINNPNFGKKLTNEHKNKISLSMKGKYVGNKNSFFGKTHSDETKDIIRKKILEKKHSDETKEKMSISHKNKLWYYNDKGEHLRTFFDDPRIISEGWKKGRLFGKEISFLANEKRKLKYSIVEPLKPNSKKCMIDDLVFNSAVEAAKYFNIPDSTVRDRIRNKNFPTWKWIDKTQIKNI
jgi:group I intron endonuclease